MKKLVLLLFVIPLLAHSQTYLLGPQPFDSDILMHGTTGNTSAWFAPDYSSPIAFIASGGNPGGNVGYSASFNNFWGNFLRLPQVNCVGNDTVLLTVDMSNSYGASSPNDWIRFYLWDQGSSAYRNDVVSIKINGVESMVDFGVNGKGFRFNVARNWVHVEVKFNIAPVTNKSNILFYIEPNCYYNNSNTFYAYFDNIGIVTSSVYVSVPENQEVNITAYPNPANQWVNVQCPANRAIQRIELFDINGRLVLEKMLDGSREYRFSTQELSEGRYNLRLQFCDHQYSQRSLIISH